MMKRFAASLLVWTTMVWATLLAPVFAAEGTEEEESKSYVLSYVLVVLSVGLGLFVVCRMGNRQNKKIKPKKEEEDWD